MPRLANLTPEEAKVKQNKAKADYLKARTKLNFVYDDEIARHFRLLAKYRNKSLAELIKLKLEEDIETEAKSRGESTEEFLSFLEKTFGESIDKDANARRKS